jgi:hypothetical protein
MMMGEGQQQQQQQQQQQHQALEPVATKELEKLLSIPLDELGLDVLNLDHYSDLIAFLPWNNRREVALTMLKAVTNTTSSSKSAPDSVREIEELFSVIAPVLRGEYDPPPTTNNNMDQTANLMAGLGVSPQQQHQQQFHNGAVGGGGIDHIQYQQDSALVSKFIGMLDNSDTDILFGMLNVARIHLSAGRNRASTAHVALVFASLKLARRIFNDEEQEQCDDGDDGDDDGDDDDCDAPPPPSEEEKADDIDEAAKVEPVTAKENDTTTTTDGDDDDDDDDDVEGSNEKEEVTKKTDETIEDETNNNCDTTNGDDTDKKEKETEEEEEAPEEDKKPAAKEEIVSPKVENPKKTPKTVR